jgi:mannose/fructose/N-acetylgalactosamine-specific phosphotransferase system component IIB
VGIVLYRVDERLIHGQVVIGWGSQLNPDRYLVVDDKLAASDWEQELYRLSLPEGVTAEFVGSGQARKLLPLWQDESPRSVLLTRDIQTMLSLAEVGLLYGASVNMGGIHHAPGRTQVRSYLYLDDEDRKRLQRLEELGVTVTARDLPDSVRVSLSSLLKE